MQYQCGGLFPVSYLIQFESVQTGALKIIFPAAETYSKAFQLAKLTTLADWRKYLCSKYMDNIKQSDHSLFHLLSKPAVNSCHYNLRTTPWEFYLFGNLIHHSRTRRSEELFYI